VNERKEDRVCIVCVSGATKFFANLREDSADMIHLFFVYGIAETLEQVPAYLPAIRRAVADENVVEKRFWG
jgi:hypothetical protein